MDHDSGYVVYKSVVQVHEGMVGECKRQVRRGTAIFNNATGGGNDRLRKQCELNVTPKIARVLQSLQHFLQQLAPRLTPSPWSIVHSASGCQAQLPHTDWEPNATFQALVLQGRNGWDFIPLSVLVALEPCTSVVVWPGSYQRMWQDPYADISASVLTSRSVVLEAGDVLVFRGDLIHAGDAYPLTDNTRLHCYLDSDLVKRSSNKTWIIEHHQGALNALLLRGSSYVQTNNETVEERRSSFSTNTM